MVLPNRASARDDTQEMTKFKLGFHSRSALVLSVPSSNLDGQCWELGQIYMTTDSDHSYEIGVMEFTAAALWAVGSVRWRTSDRLILDQRCRLTPGRTGGSY